MKATGLMTKETKKDMSVIQMAILMKETSRKEKLMARESITGLMEKSMMENGVKESRMAMACGKVYLEIAIWANGSTQKLMGMECISGKMEIDLKVAGINV
jgi:hypothetical protein